MGLRKLQKTWDTADPEKKDSLQFFAASMAAERGEFAEAERLFQECRQVPALAGWSIFGQAFVALRGRDYELAEKQLKEAEDANALSHDAILHAAIDHLRGTLQFHERHAEQALKHLAAALKQFGKDHFATGRVLDTFGMLYAGKDNFHTAEEFYQQAIRCKERFDDQAGLAVSYGNLGRLYLDWGYLDRAQDCFEKDLQIAQKTLDERGAVQMCNHLGQVSLARGDGAAALGQAAEARKHWNDAIGLLDESLAQAGKHGWTILEGYARKDRARLYLAHEVLSEAEVQAGKAEALFRDKDFDEGVAHVNRVWAVLRRKQGRFDDAFRLLGAALAWFEKTNEQAELARTQLEMARTRQAARSPRPLIVKEYLKALELAEACRRPHLVQPIDDELRLVDPEAYWYHAYQRVRGRLVEEPTVSLITGRREPLTVLYLDIKGSTIYTLGRPPEEVMMTLNQMMADFVAVLRRHQGQVSYFRGDGFLALFREANHAVRTVSAGLELFQELEAFNGSRRVLGLQCFEARVGIATGEVYLGNVGTYDKMDYTAIGTAANLGAHLEGVAEPGLPCISRQTYEDVGTRFVYKPGSPRTVHVKALGEQQVWDVQGRG